MTTEDRILGRSGLTFWGLNMSDLTDQIMDALRPVLHDKPSVDVIKALATTFWGATIAAGLTPIQSLALVRDYADQLDPTRRDPVQKHHDTKYGSRDGGSAVHAPPDVALYTAFGIEFRT